MTTSMKSKAQRRPRPAVKEGVPDAPSPTTVTGAAAPLIHPVIVTPVLLQKSPIPRREIDMEKHHGRVVSPHDRHAALIDGQQ